MPTTIQPNPILNPLTDSLHVRVEVEDESERQAARRITTQTRFTHPDLSQHSNNQIDFETVSLFVNESWKQVSHAKRYKFATKSAEQSSEIMQWLLQLLQLLQLLL